MLNVKLWRKNRLDKPYKVCYNVILFTLELFLEIWKAIKNFEEWYEVSSLGRVRSLPRKVKHIGESYQQRPGKMMRLQKRKSNHLDVLIKMNGLEKRCWVHRLVAEAFILNPEGLPIVNHIDSNPENNELSNLEWCTQKHNINHCVKAGRFNPKTGETSPFNKLKTEEVIEMRERFALGGVTKRQLAKDYKVCEAVVGNIIRRKKWKHI